MQDQYLIDKARVRASFSRAASQYDAAAILQKTVRHEMINRLDLMTISPEVILDAGCGTGHGLLALQKRYPKSHIFALDIAMGMIKQTQANLPFFTKLFGNKNLVCADIENIPFADASVDFIWSNLAIQWCNDLDKMLENVRRILKPNGLFMFSTFGPDTLKELRLASQNNQTHVSRFLDMHDIGDALTRAGLNAPVLDVEKYTLTYDDAIGLMRDLKAIGANNATQGRSKGLSGRGFLEAVQRNYEPFRQNGKLPATYEVVYGHAWQSQMTEKPQNEFKPIQFVKKQS
jgi:malonyl-CoA O-methyltransferase